MLGCWVRFRIAALFSRMGRTEHAIALLKSVIQQCPDHLAARNELAWCLSNIERYEEAIAHYRLLADRLPHWVEPWLGLGEAFQRLGRHDEAIAAYSSAIECDLSSALAHFNIADSYCAKGDLQSALVAYRRVMTIEPTNGHAAGNLGATLGLLGHWRDAVEWHRKAMALDPNTIHACNLGVALSELEEPEAAEGAFREAMKLGDTSAEVKAHLALAISDQGRWDEALRVVEEVLVQDPSDAQALVVKSGTLLQLNRGEDALAAARLAIDAHPDKEESRGALAWALLKVGQPAEALSTFESLQPSHHHVDVSAGRGAALSALGRHEEAMAIFDAIRRAEPDYFETRPDFAAEYLARSRAALRR
jgi:protein O-GlcNAc transferase